jgi:hypothetical protein
MPTGLNSRWLQRFAALVAVFLIGHSINVDWMEGEAWWVPVCFLAIMLVIEFLAFRHGIATGINIYRSLDERQRRDMDKLFEGTEQ